MSGRTPTSTSRYFAPLEQTDFQCLRHAPYLKGLLKPFTDKGSLETWADQCEALRDSLISLAQRRVLAQAKRYPFDRFAVQLAQQTTGAGTTFLRWRNADRSRMGTALWTTLLTSAATPPALIDDLYAIEQQRAVLNMQISLLHHLALQARACASTLERAEFVYQRRQNAVAHRVKPTEE
jgi:Protein of unknown function (DUF3158)